MLSKTMEASLPDFQCYPERKDNVAGIKYIYIYIYIYIYNPLSLRRRSASPSDITVAQPTKQSAPPKLPILAYAC
jgi:hypothetical protein